jgi:hypothetical protein
MQNAELANKKVNISRAAIGLSAYRLIGLSAYRLIGLSAYRLIGLSAYRLIKP